LRLVRGTGARGLAGIPARRRLGPGIDVVRPLLGLTRADVLAHAKRFRVVWREDASNASPTRARNRIRHEVLPLLQTFNPDAERVLARAATQAGDASRLVARETARAFRRVVRREPQPEPRAKGKVTLDRTAWASLAPELGALVMRTALSEVRGDAGTRSAQVEAACAIARKGRGRADIEGAVVTVTRDTVRISTARR
jgi:tRNA(Ile)-lysidine synthase